MDGINKELQSTIDRDVTVKEATKRAQSNYEQRRADARCRIQDLRELKQLEDGYLLDFEL